MFVKPVLGQEVFDPERGDLLPAEGRNVTPMQFWYARLEEGVVVEASPAEEKPAGKKKE